MGETFELKENDEISFPATSEGSFGSLVNSMNTSSVKEVETPAEPVAEKKEEPKEEAKQPEPVPEEKKQVNEVKVDYKIEEILYAMPLEPCVLFVQVSTPNNLVTYEAKGIPGFIDVEHKRFFLLNGEQIPDAEFNTKFKEFVDRELKTK